MGDLTMFQVDVICHCQSREGDFRPRLDLELKLNELRQPCSSLCALFRIYLQLLGVISTKVPPPSLHTSKSSTCISLRPNSLSLVLNPKLREWLTIFIAHATSCASRASTDRHLPQAGQLCHHHLFKRACTICGCVLGVKERVYE